MIIEGDKFMTNHAPVGVQPVPGEQTGARCDAICNYLLNESIEKMEKSGPSG